MKTFVFRVVVDTEEDIFRDIQIREDQNFEQLHESIIIAFGFQGDEMASFYMSNEMWEKGEEIGLMDMGFGEGEGQGPATMKSTLIGNKINDDHQKILYVYDFLKMWIFYIELIDIKDETEGEFPRVVREFGPDPDENSKGFADLMDGILEEDPAPKKKSEYDAFQSELDDILGEDEEDEMGGFENIDDYDI